MKKTMFGIASITLYQSKLKPHFMFVATTNNLQKNNKFIYGGVPRYKFLKLRLEDINKGRKNDDHVYFVKTWRALNYLEIEEKMSTMLPDFVTDDYKKGLKTVHMNYDSLDHLMTGLCEQTILSPKQYKFSRDHWIENTLQNKPVPVMPLGEKEYM